MNVSTSTYRFCIIFCFLFLSSEVYAQKTIFVNSGNTQVAVQDGHSWTTAFSSLQDALAIAQEGDEIWTATGIYKPSINNRDASFNLPNGVMLLGGFDGTEVTSEERDYLNNVTILSGDLAGNDNSNIQDTEVSRSENSYHVVTTQAGARNGTVIDGFTITGGNANGNYPNNSGAGLWNQAQGASNTSSIRNCTFINHTASFLGGAVFNDGSLGGDCSPSFANTSFSQNFSANHGGAVYNYGLAGHANPIFTYCEFLANVSAVSGAAMYNDGSIGNATPYIANTRFESNTSYGYAGAIYNNGQSGKANPILMECQFVQNTATVYGGAFYNNGSSAGESNPSIQQCMFIQNDANSGGAIFNNGLNGNASPEITSCCFHGNTAMLFGGAIYNFGEAMGNSSPEVKNAGFSGNKAGMDGGAIFSNGNQGMSMPTFTNCTFSANIADSNNDGSGIGGALYNRISSVVINNCILWDNSRGNGISDQMGNNLSATSISYSIIEGGYTGMGNIDMNPEFADVDGADNILGTADDNLMLGLTSPAVNMGTPDTTGLVLPSVDLAGEARIEEGRIDIGAYERISPTSFPIELLSFEATLNTKEEVELSWATATELNNDYFTIERATDNSLEFESIATVQGAGTSTSPIAYQTIDKTPANGINYYRLKQTDFDGSYTYSSIIEVRVEGLTTNIKVWNNPTTVDNIKFQLMNFDGTVNVNLRSINGQIVHQEKMTIADNDAYAIHPNNLTGGIYLLEIQEGFQTYVEKLIIQ